MTFALLSLPLLPLYHVFENIHLKNLFCLTTISKKMHSLVRSYTKSKSFELQINCHANSRKITLKHWSEQNIDRSLNFECFISITGKQLKFGTMKLGETQFPYTSDTDKSIELYVDNLIDDLFVILNFFKNTFGSLHFSPYFYPRGDQFFRPIFEYFERERVVLGKCVIALGLENNEELVTLALNKLLYSADRLHITISHNFRHTLLNQKDISLKQIHSRSSHWFTKEHFDLMKECQRFVLLDGNLTGETLNQILQEWKKSSRRITDFRYSAYNFTQLAEVLNGWDAKELRTEYRVETPPDADIVQKEIEKEDGTLASITLSGGNMLKIRQMEKEID